MRPFVKWAGGKRQIIDELLKYVPKSYNTYFEPFVGGGALFFELEPKKAVINDFNKELIGVYQTVKQKNNHVKLMELLDEYEKNHTEENYYKIRNLDRNKDEFNRLKKIDKAARVLYLNKTCFNGLYRVNSKGEFNVPFNNKKSVNLYEEDNLEDIHKYLYENKVSITSGDYRKCLRKAKKGDFVYLDPPYDETFTSYTKNDFDRDDQITLSNEFKKLNKKGVKVMLSNNNTDLIRELYKNFNIHIVNAKRNINSKSDGRGYVEEVIITNY